MSKLTIHVDASALKESSCMLRFYRTVVEGWREPLQNNDVEFGSALHLFVATMKRTGGNYAAAVKAAQERYRVPMNMKPRKAYMTEQFLIKTCLDFWQRWIDKDQFETIKADNGEPLVELKFSWPYYEDDNLAIMIAGTIDDVSKHKQGIHALRDYKTTSMYDSTEYLSAYKLNPQLMLYTWICRQYAKKYPDSMFAKIAHLGFGCFIDGIFLRGKDKEPEFVRSEIFQFKDWEMDEFESELANKVANLRNMIMLGRLNPQYKFPRDGILTNSCSTNYGPCKFAKVCSMPDNEAAQIILERDYIKKPYDPATF